jgi:hypothetical protein
MRWWWLVLVAGCGGDEVRECDVEGTPTCDSSLIVYLPDARNEFTLRVELDGLNLTAVCPDPDGSQEIDAYTLTCGAGQITIRTNLSFPDTVVVQLEALPPETHMPNYQQGGDFCANPCTIGSIQL